MPQTPKKDIDQLFNDQEGMSRALGKAVRQALLQHKRAGNPIATWRDGKVVWIEPEKIEVQDDEYNI